MQKETKADVVKSDLEIFFLGTTLMLSRITQNPASPWSEQTRCSLPGSVTAPLKASSFFSAT